jgi:hypothetical protein
MSPMLVGALIVIALGLVLVVALLHARVLTPKLGQCVTQGQQRRARIQSCHRRTTCRYRRRKRHVMSRLLMVRMRGNRIIKVSMSNEGPGQTISPERGGRDARRYPIATRGQ